MSYEQIPDFRFDGYDNDGLSKLVKDFSSSNGAQAFGEASTALRELADELKHTDDLLRAELAKLGIDWVGAAGDNAGKTITASADHGTGSTDAGQEISTATMDQSDADSRARNSMPQPAALQGPTNTNAWDDVNDFFGNETDNAKKVKETNAARQQTIDSLNGYVGNSQSALDGFRDPGKPPNFEVTTTSSVISTPGGSGIPGHVGPTGIPGGVPGGVPGGIGSIPGGGNNAALPPQLPGGSSGINPQIPGTAGAAPTGPALPKVPGSMSGLGLGLGLAGAAGLGAAAATARGGRVVRGPSGGAAAKPGATPPAATGKGGAGAGVKPGMPGGAPGSVGTNATNTAGKLGAAGMSGIDGDERAANRGGTAAAGKAGLKGGPGSMMQPAATGKGEGDEDGEHVRKYGVDSDDVFGDERMVVQSVIGEEPEPK